MNSEKRYKADSVIDEIFVLTGDQHLYHHIDQPIEQAANTWEFNHTDPFTHQTFIQALGGFLRHVYEKGLPFPKKLTISQAQAEALDILDKGYKNAYARGYDAAFLDAFSLEENGLQLVLVQLAELITGIAREAYVKWIYTSINLLKIETIKMLRTVLWAQGRNSV